MKVRINNFFKSVKTGLDTFWEDRAMVALLAAAGVTAVLVAVGTSGVIPVGSDQPDTDSPPTATVGTPSASLPVTGVTDTATPDPTVTVTVTVTATPRQTKVPVTVSANRTKSVSRKIPQGVSRSSSNPEKAGRVLSRWGWVHKNTYFGPGYDPKYEVTRQCLVVRESNDHRTAINSGGYSGYYQFGLTWTRTIQHWTKEYVPINQMSTKAQDKAWWLAWNHGAGQKHWSGGRWACPGVRY